MTASTKTRAGDEEYLELVRTFPLRPLKNKTGYERALEVMDGLASRAEDSLSVDEQDYLQALSLLIEQYDLAHSPSAGVDADPLDVLKHLMEENDMSTSDLGRLLGSKGVASEVLNGKRDLSKAHIAALAARFNVDVGLFFPVVRKPRQQVHARTAKPRVRSERHNAARR